MKVLDFGLAKIAASGHGAHVDSSLPTEMRTRDGVVMGTVPYMSPEQAQGRALDHRYEKAFEDRTPNMVFASVGVRISPELVGNKRYDAIIRRMGFPDTAR